MKYSFWSFVGSLFFLVFSSKSYAFPNDFDGDGRSDFILVNILKDKSLSWSSINSSNNAENDMGSLGQNGDHIILGSWKGAPSSQIGIVSVNGKSLVWKIKSGSEVEEREFGRSNHTAMSGADFDGDGFGDAAVAVLKKSKVKWEIAYNLFNSLVGQARVSKLSFGKAGDRIFFASVDGQNDWIGTLGKGVKGKGSLLRLKNLKTGAVKSSTKIPKNFVAKRIRPLPLDNGAGDYLVFPLVVKGNTTIDIRTINGVQVAKATLPGKGDVVVGNFSDQPGEEVAIKTSAGFTVYSPVSQTSFDVPTLNGIAVDSVNINTFSSGNSGNNGNNGGSTPPSGGNSACSSVVSWPGSHIYKTVGSHHFTDVRRNTSGIILKRGGRGPYPTCISIVDTKGNVVAKMGRYAIGESLWQARYYAGIGCGSSTPYSGASMASRARSNTGSSFVYANFGSVCYGPIDANRCIGSSQC